MQTFNTKVGESFIRVVQSAYGKRRVVGAKLVRCVNITPAGYLYINKRDRFKLREVFPIHQVEKKYFLPSYIVTLWRDTPENRQTFKPDPMRKPHDKISK